LSFGIKTRAG